MENHEVMISIGDTAKELGVSVKTIRRWANAGKLRFERSPSGHRRFFLADIKRITPRDFNKLEDRVTINYARVSSHDQKDDLTRQIQVLEAFSGTNGWQFETIQDLGSGLNYNKKGLQKLLKRIMKGDVGRLVVTHKDRLLRFGSELVFAMCEEYETEVVIINKSAEEITFEQELVTDMIELITVFSARLYGSRSRKNKKLLDNVAKAVQESS
ncbi:IS607 family transposase [Nodularia phage vB_NspS-kac65v162]|jgi:putative resolvase|uniref:IS607 family transposase n=5 Tax=Ravarandavirus TaxID=2843444 RepID=A0A482MIW0_9CAUD|nr:transposase [Nodularia phage vB_NspS-kac65v151]YP_009844896.1 transposase [Nodularia phage vB_NspS-kac68v161]QBQ73319.1 IS607 family transposase [Nodularia phage vB_NspS-kac65v161]QBQ73525.1 IS607 family transposase [Nodularia phage vB_NspS-kac65v162]QBQ73931.1 IS607 family transposase [Nodularia phage vB_NspS-kac68v162]QBQ73111.1 IS607 family transposase [Nodularia phage vB_NspS-kac65v151]QBQ73737.1 IS607 family transposase [Nodularia phage vB_NspS-kac68v161]